MKKITYLDGLKGVIAILIVLEHYLLSMLPTGYIGFGSGVQEQDKQAAIINALPFSLFTNTSLTLYVLFGLIAFFVALGYFYAESANSSEAVKYLICHAKKRYFQLLFPVLVATMCAYLFYQFGILQYEKMGEITGSSWNIAVIPDKAPMWKVIYTGAIGIFLHNKVEFLTVLWCMHIIFWGSYGSLGAFALVHLCKKRYLVYGFLLILCSFFQTYLVFLVGMLCADYYFHKKENRLSHLHTNLVGGICMVSGILIGMIPSTMLMDGVTLGVPYAVGAGLIIFGIITSDEVQKILSLRVFTYIGKYLFSIILVHIFVLYTFSTELYIVLTRYLSNQTVRFWITFLLSCVVIWLTSFLFYALIERPARNFARYIEQGKRKKE